MPSVFQGGKMMGFTIAMFAYLGPETMLPMTSVVAAVAGVVMMFGRNSVRWIQHSFRSLVARPKVGAKAPRRIGTRPVGGVARHAASQAEARA